MVVLKHVLKRVTLERRMLRPPLREKLVGALQYIPKRMTLLRPPLSREWELFSTYLRG
jgi:hypothetical protein